MNPDQQTTVAIAEGIYPRPLTLGKGIRGKLENAIRESQIPLIDYFGRRDHQAITPGRAHLPTQMPDESGIQDMGDGEFSGFNKLFPRLVQAFLLNRKFYVEDMYIEGVPTGNSDHLLPVLFDMYQSSERQQRNNGVVARVVFGASEQMSLRSLSYMLPALLHMQHLQEETGQTIPQLQLIFTKYTSGGLNGLDVSNVARETALCAQLAERFIQRFFPKLRKHVVFLEDTPLSDDEYRTQLEGVAGALDGHTDFRLLETKAAARRGTQTARLYGAAHVLLHETRAEGILRPLVDRDGQPVFSNQSILPATGIINYGGIQELPFYVLRQEARSLPMNFLPSIQLFTRHHVPPYFMAEGGDIGLREAVAISRNERGRRREALAPKAILNRTYQPRGNNGAVHEDLEFLYSVTEDRETDYRNTPALDTFLDALRDMANTI